MTSLSDGLSNVYSLTDKINAIKAGKLDPSIKTANNQPLDPDQALIDIAQSFNDMLNSLISDPDDEKNKTGNDMFASLISNQNLQNQLTNPMAGTLNNLNVNPITGALDILGT
ncbi:MAG: hypothetical protein ABIH50_01935 [bacterium]